MPSKSYKVPHYRTSPIFTRGSKCGPNLLQQHHHKAREALRSATEGDRAFTSIWDRWQNDQIYRKSQLAHNWSDAWVRYLDHIVHFSICHNATQPQRERKMSLLHLRSVDGNKQAPPLSQRPGCREATKELSNLQKARREEQVDFIPTHPPLPAGHQAQHGGVRLHGLRVGRDGTSTVGRTTHGQKKWWVGQSRTRVFEEVEQATKKLVRADSRRQAPRCHHQPESLTAVLFFYRSCWIWISHSASGNSREYDGRCGHHTYLYARRRTFFSCTHHSAQFIHWSALFQCGHTALPQGKRNLCRAFLCTHFHLVVKSLLDGPLGRFPLVTSSPTCSLSRPSASSTSSGRSGVTPFASAHWSGMSGCLPNPTPDTGYDLIPTSTATWTRSTRRSISLTVTEVSRAATTPPWSPTRKI